MPRSRGIVALLTLTLAVTGTTWATTGANAFAISPDDFIVVGDWNGDGVSTPGVVRPNGNHWQWFLRNSNSSGDADYVFVYGPRFDSAGNKTWPVVGDWGAGSDDTPGVVIGNQWHLRTSNSSGDANIVFTYGLATDLPLVGDWNGNGVDTPAALRFDFDLGRWNWLLSNSHNGGNADFGFTYGPSSPFTARPIAGDWNGDGTDSPGVVLDKDWYLKNTNSSGNADLTFHYGATQIPEDFVTGDWNGRDSNGRTVDTPGVVRETADGTHWQWFLRTSNSSGDAQITYVYG